MQFKTNDYIFYGTDGICQVDAVCENPFEGALFIGDSRTVGIGKYAGITESDYAHFEESKSIPVNGSFALPAHTYADMECKVSTTVVVGPRLSITDIAILDGAQQEIHPHRQDEKHKQKLVL